MSEWEICVRMWCHHSEPWGRCSGRVTVSVGNLSTVSIFVGSSMSHACWDMTHITWHKQETEVFNSLHEQWKRFVEIFYRKSSKVWHQERTISLYQTMYFHFLFISILKTLRLRFLQSLFFKWVTWSPSATDLICCSKRESGSVNVIYVNVIHTQ